MAAAAEPGVAGEEEEEEEQALLVMSSSLDQQNNIGARRTHDLKEEFVDTIQEGTSKSDPLLPVVDGGEEKDKKDQENVSTDSAVV